MNTTLIHRGGTSEHHPAFAHLHHANTRGRGPHEPEPALRHGTSLQRGVAALGAAALLAILSGSFPSAIQAVTCSPGKLGTLNDDNTFTEGTTGVDYRVVCTGDADGREVTGDDLEDALDHADADSLDDVSYVDEFVVELSNANWRHHDDEVGELPTTVVLGNVQGNSGANGIDFFGDGMDFWNDWNFESHASIRTTGGGIGLDVGVGSDPYYGTLRGRNFGRIETTGGALRTGTGAVAE